MADQAPARAAGHSAHHDLAPWVACPPVSTAEAGHPAWCHPQHCFLTDEGVRVHQQAPTCWEDDTAEVVRFESRLIDPGDDEHVYLDLHLQCLRLRGNGFSWVVPLDTARRLRDQLTEHLDAVQ